MRDYLLFLFVLLIAASGAKKVNTETSQHGEKPNVLFIVIDDLRPALGCYDYPKVISPNIDQLAKHSVVFDNAFVQEGVCGPSRTSFLTGRRPDTTRLYDFKSYWRTHAGNFTTIPQHFKNNGYFTYSIGKVFHPGKASGRTDDYPYSWSKPAYHGSTEQYKNAKVCPGPSGEYFQNICCAVNVSTQPEQSLPDLQSTDHAIQMIKSFQRKKSSSGKDQPFFLAVGLHKPHVPFKFPEEYLNLYPIEEIDLAPDPFIPESLPPVARNVWYSFRARDDIAALNLTFPDQLIPDYFHKRLRQHYYSAITYIDDQVGRILHRLEKSGFSQNTIVSFIGDHGWSLGEHGTWCKFSNFEVVTRAPMMVYVPNVTNQLSNEEKFTHISPFDSNARINDNPNKISSKVGIRSNALVELVDLFPTLSDLSGLEVPTTCPEDSSKITLCTEGHSFANLIRTNNYDERNTFKTAAFSQYPRPSDIPQNNSDLPNLRDIRIMGYSMRTEHHRYTEWVSFDPNTFKANFSQVHAVELYLHRSDPLEVYNVAGFSQYQKLQQKLKKKLVEGWRSALPAASRAGSLFNSPSLFFKLISLLAVHF